MKTITRKLPLIARVLLGAVFLFSGLNKVLHFVPQPMPAGAAAEFMGGLAASGYLFPLLALTEIVAGAALLVGRFVPLALTLLAPVVVNIAGYHFALAPEGAPVAVVLIALEAYLGWSYRASFAPMLQSNARPAGSSSSVRSTSFAEAR